MVLAAGFGSRLGTLSDERPKPLLPIAGVPLVRWAMALLRAAGIPDVVVNLHHRGDLIAAELAAPPSVGMKVAFSREEKILGTGGGIRHALPLLDASAPIVVVNGKIVFDLDLADVLAQHHKSGAHVTMVVRPDAEAKTWGPIEVAPDGIVRSILDGRGDHMFTGVHVIEPSLVARLPDDGQERCIIRQGYKPWMAAGTAKIHAYVADGYFMEHSTPARYLDGNANVLHGRASVRHPPPGIAGVDPAASVAPTAKIIPPVRIDAGAVIDAGATVGPTVAVGRGAIVRANVHLTESIVWPDATVDADAHRTIVTPTQRVTA